MIVRLVFNRPVDSRVRLPRAGRAADASRAGAAGQSAVWERRPADGRLLRDDRRGPVVQKAPENDRLDRRPRAALVGQHAQADAVDRRLLPLQLGPGPRFGRARGRQTEGRHADRHVVCVCRAAGQKFVRGARLSAKQKAVLEILAASGRPMDAAELTQAADCGTAPLARAASKRADPRDPPARGPFHVSAWDRRRAGA